MTGRLQDKVAIITGAGSVGPGWGNGRATAVRFAQEGAKIFAVDRNLDSTAETIQRVQAIGGDITVHECDVTDSESVAAMVEACLARYGRVLLKRKWLVLSVTVLVFAVGATYTWRLPRTYSSSVNLQIEPEQNVLGYKEAFVAATPDTAYLRTQEEAWALPEPSPTPGAATTPAVMRCRRGGSPSPCEGSVGRSAACARIRSVGASTSSRRRSSRSHRFVTGRSPRRRPRGRATGARCQTRGIARCRAPRVGRKDEPA